MNASLIYYTNDKLPEQLRNQCLACVAAMEGFAEVILVVPPGRSYDFAECLGKIDEQLEKDLDALIIEAEGVPGHHDICVKTLAGLQKAKGDVAYLIEHDVLYPADYLDTIAVVNGGKHVYYNLNAITVNHAGYLVQPGRPLTSNAFARVEILWEIYSNRLRHLTTGGRIKWGEPGRNPGDGPFKPVTTNSPSPVLDIRWGGNLTGRRTGPTTQTAPYWGPHKALWASLQLNGVSPHED